MTGLVELPARIARLKGDSRARADRLLDVRVVTGRTDSPTELEPWLARTFGSIDAVREQTVIKVTNLVTLEATLFAPLRGRRPIDGPMHARDVSAEISATEGDPFCTPLIGTPADQFGRIRGTHMITGANAAMADAHHAVVVFGAHDPLAFDADLVSDLFGTGRAWAERGRDLEPAATNYLLIWNCLWRAGGSIIHGHAQALLGSGPGYARLARFRRDALAYHAAHDADLVDDLVAVHHDLGLTTDHERGATVLAHLTPMKEREVLVVGEPGMDERHPAFTTAVWRTLRAYRDAVGVRSFNLALWRPPLDGSWGAFPPIVRLVDRGDLFERPSDIGGMELYGTPIVGSDPYDLVAALG